MNGLGQEPIDMQAIIGHAPASMLLRAGTTEPPPSAARPAESQDWRPPLYCALPWSEELFPLSCGPAALEQAAGDALVAGYVQNMERMCSSPAVLDQRECLSRALSASRMAAVRGQAESAWGSGAARDLEGQPEPDGTPWAVLVLAGLAAVVLLGRS